MESGVLGKEYEDGEVIVRQGEVGDCMYVIQAGKVDVLYEGSGETHRLTSLGKGSFFGEMALFGREVRSATVKAAGKVRVLSVDKKTLLKRIHQDPSLAFHIVENLSSRIRELDTEIARLKGRG